MADPTPPNQPNAAANLADQALKAAQAAIASLKGGPATPPPAAAESEPTPEEAAMLAAMATPASKPQTAPAPAMMPPAQAFQLPSFERPTAAELPKGMDLLSDVNLNVKIELGRTRMVVEDVLKLGEGAVVELDKLAGDPVDVYVNDRHIARGEVLVLNDNFCVRINEIIAHVDGSPGGKSGKK